jgi:predicted transcriptional regulator
MAGASAAAREAGNDAGPHLGGMQAPCASRRRAAGAAEPDAGGHRPGAVPDGRSRLPCGIKAVSSRFMAMTLRLSDEQTEALRRRADREGRSMQQVALAALEDYLVRAEDDERTDRLAERGAQRYAELLRRLGE